MIDFNKNIKLDNVRSLQSEVELRILEANNIIPTNVSSYYNSSENDRLKISKKIHDYHGYVSAIQSVIDEMLIQLDKEINTAEHWDPLFDFEVYKENPWINQYVKDNLKLTRKVFNIEVIKVNNPDDEIANNILKKIILIDQYIISPLKNVFLINKDYDFDIGNFLTTTSKMISYLKGLYFSLQNIIEGLYIELEDLNWQFPYNAEEFKKALENLDRLSISLDEKFNQRLEYKV